MRRLFGTHPGATATLVAIALMAVRLQAQQASSTVPPLDSAISGVVIDALTGQPLGDAVVSLSPGGGRPVRQQTDSLGRFVYPELRGGVTYVITASRLGYLSSDETPQALSRAHPRVSLATGQWARDVRVALWPPAAISGTVVDAHGEPVVGAFVRVLLKTDFGGRTRVVAGPIATTDDLGRYRITSLAKGSYLVALVSVSESVASAATQGELNNMSTNQAAGRPARPPIVGTRASGDTSVLLLGRHNTDSGLGFTYAGQYFAGVTNATSATPVTVEYGEDRRGVDFALQRVPSWSVSGIVNAPAEELAALSLRLVPAGSEGLGVGSETATTRPAADGRFTLLAVPSGRYTLIAAPSVSEFTIVSALTRTRLPAMQGQTLVRVAAASESVMFGGSQTGEGSSWGQQVVVVEDRDLHGVEVNVRRGVSISGHIVLEPGSDPPVNRTGAIVVEPSLENEWLTLPQFKVVEPNNGASSWSVPRVFEIRGLPAGRYYLKSNLADVLIKSVVSNGRDLVNGPIDVSNDGDLTDVTVTITTRVATLSGMVQMSTVQAVGGAAVICFPADPGARMQFGLNPIRTRTVLPDATGAFRIAGLPAGDYLVVAVPESQREAWRDTKFLDAASQVAARVRLEWGATANQVVRVESVRAR